MKKLFILFFAIYSFTVFAQDKKSALIIIDIQDFYFPGGFSELVGPEKAAQKAANILEHYRKNNQEVIHVQHATEKQMEINNAVAANKGEERIVKTEINAFNGTHLKTYLDSLEIKHLTIVGMQTHMCVEAATRAAYDHGYKVTLIEDACATKDLQWGDVIIPAGQVHKSTLSTLKNYAEINTAEEFLNK